MKVLDKFKQQYMSKSSEEMTIEEYLKRAKKDPSLYASPHQRLLKAIGDPVIVDTSKDTRLSRIFGNRIIKTYPTFSDFYGMEDTITRIVSFLKHSSQGLEESKQILYLLGPVGSAKSSLAERLKELMEQEPIYVLKFGNSELSPIHESPLSLFNESHSKELGIPKRYLRFKMSPWARSHLNTSSGDINKFTVVKMWPSQLDQVAISKTEPGDENCLLGDHEFLTPTGWKRIDEYVQGDLVAQYTNDGQLEFVMPTEYVAGTSKEIIHFKNRSISLSVTPSHRMVYETRGRNGANVLVRYHNAGEGQFSSAFAIQTAIGGGSGIDLSENELKLQVAIAADGSFRKDNSTNYCIVELTKERKQDRLETLLSLTGIEYSITVSTRGTKVYTFYAPQRNKSLAAYWEASHEQLNTIAEEVVHWDGHLKKGNRGAFFTTDKEEADFVQYALIATGRRSTISVRKNNNTNHKDLYIVNINKDTTRINYGEISQQIEEGSFPVYCFNVPSTMFLTRRDGIIAVTGNNQDISALVGKINIRKLEYYDQNQPEAYSFSGGLCLGNRGILEFVEMFKAPIKMLHPLLTATQENNYVGTEQIGAIQFDGIILAHSNQTEWNTFKNDTKNEAFIDRICLIKVPYNLRVNEEILIYKKLIDNSELSKYPCAPNTLKMLAQFAVMSRLVVPENSALESKMKVYNGQSVKDKDMNAKSLQEYSDLAGVMEGMSGISTRFCFKTLSQVFNFDNDEIAANPVHLMYILENNIKQEQFPSDVEESYLGFIKGVLSVDLAYDLDKAFKKAYLEHYGEYGQSVFDKYILYADYWLQDREYRDPESGQVSDRENLNKFLNNIEIQAGISNSKDFRHEVFNYVLRYRSRHNGENPAWTSYEKLKTVIEAHLFEKTEDLLPIISFEGAAKTKDKQTHESFIKRMKDMGYTEKQVRLLYEWLLRYKANS